ncbi:MAG TPA: DMT family transporter [Chloroflexia bacterium]|nr:DMT family transporter [Chloroflexia bacterium]
MQKRDHNQAGITAQDGLMLGLVVVWGANFSVLKLGLDVMPPQLFNGIRMAMAAVIFVVFLAVQGGLRWRREDTLKIMGLGLIGHAGYQILFIEGLSRTAVGNSALMLASVPMWVAIIGAALGYERLSRSGWIGIGLAFAGVAAVIIGSNQSFSADSLLGDGLTLVATLCWSGYTAFSQPLLTRYSPVQLSGMSLTAAVPVLALAGILAPPGLAYDWGRFNVEALLALLFGGILSVNVCYVIWYRGVQKLGGARTAIFSNITPLVAIVVAWVWRDEPLQPVYAVGAVLIAGGVLMTRFSRPSVPHRAVVAAEADSAVGTG